MESGDGKGVPGGSFFILTHIFYKIRKVPKVRVTFLIWTAFVVISIFGHFFHFCFPRLNKFLIIKKNGQNKKWLNNFVHQCSMFLA